MQRQPLSKKIHQHQVQICAQSCGCCDSPALVLCYSRACRHWRGGLFFCSQSYLSVRCACAHCAGVSADAGLFDLVLDGIGAGTDVGLFVVQLVGIRAGQPCSCTCVRNAAGVGILVIRLVGTAFALVFHLFLYSAVSVIGRALA